MIFPTFRREVLPTRLGWHIFGSRSVGASLLCDVVHEPTYTLNIDLGMWRLWEQWIKKYYKFAQRGTIDPKGDSVWSSHNSAVQWILLMKHEPKDWLPCMTVTKFYFSPANWLPNFLAYYKTRIFSLDHLDFEYYTPTECSLQLQ